jgi:hypothetical protein
VEPRRDVRALVVDPLQLAVGQEAPEI